MAFNSNNPFLNNKSFTATSASTDHKVHQATLIDYNQDMTLEAHARSAYSVRAGISIKQFTVGLGSNLDYYGPMKFDKTNHGLFVQVRL